MTVKIRQAVPGDGPALSVLGSATMLETYADKVPGADILAHCSNHHSVVTYEAWLADPGVTTWLAESATGAPVGYLVLMPTILAAASPADLEVQRIYVLSSFHGAALGHALMRLAIAEAASHGAPRLVLGVMKANTRAVAFYKRQGFRVIGARSFTVGASTFDDHVMGRSVTPGR